MITTATELKNNFSKIYHRVVDDGQSIIIAEDNEPGAVLINYSIYLDLLEELEMKERFLKSYKATRNESVINLNELKIKYGLK